MPPSAWDQSKFSLGAWYPCSGSESPRKKTGDFKTFSIERTAPIEPPSRTNTGSLANAKRIAPLIASAYGPVVMP